MAKLGNQMKLALLKGMEAIGRGASNLASNAHLKVSEMNLETRRREILSEFPLRAHDLWQKGVELPAPLGDMMSELNDLDERLSVLRAQRYAKVEGGETEGKPDEGAQTDESAKEPEGDENATDSAATETEAESEPQTAEEASAENAAPQAEEPAPQTDEPSESN